MIYPSSTESLYSRIEPYVPDFSVRVDSNLLFVRIRRAQYIAARRATMMGKANIKSEDEAFAKEWHKVKILSNLSNNDNHHLNRVHNPDKMRRASSLSVPFTSNQIESGRSSGEWKVNNSSDGGILIQNMAGDCEMIETRERSATEPCEGHLDLQQGEPKGSSGESLGYEDAKSDPDGQSERQHEQTPLITRKDKDESIETSWQTLYKPPERQNNWASLVIITYLLHVCLSKEYIIVLLMFIGSRRKSCWWLKFNLISWNLANYLMVTTCSSLDHLAIQM